MKNAPAVSQLAGEIAREIYQHEFMRGDFYSTYGNEVEALISAALSEREEKVDALIEAARNAKLQIEYLHEKFNETGTGWQAITKIDAALSALVESK